MSNSATTLRTIVQFCSTSWLTSSVAEWTTPTRNSLDLMLRCQPQIPYSPRPGFNADIQPVNHFTIKHNNRCPTSITSSCRRPTSAWSQHLICCTATVSSLFWKVIRNTSRLQRPKESTRTRMFCKAQKTLLRTCSWHWLPKLQTSF